MQPSHRSGPPIKLGGVLTLFFCVILILWIVGVCVLIFSVDPIIATTVIKTIRDNLEGRKATPSLSALSTKKLSHGERVQIEKNLHIFSYDSTLAEYREAIPGIDYRDLAKGSKTLLQEAEKIVESSQYAPLYKLGDLLTVWNPDDTAPDAWRQRSVAHPINGKGLARFDYQIAAERALALRFRDKEWPFVVFNVPELDRAAETVFTTSSLINKFELESPAALKHNNYRHQAKEEDKKDYSDQTGSFLYLRTVELAKDNHFMYYHNPNKKKAPTMRKYEDVLSATQLSRRLIENREVLVKEIDGFGKNTSIGKWKQSNDDCEEISQKNKTNSVNNADLERKPQNAESQILYQRRLVEKMGRTLRKTPTQSRIPPETFDLSKWTAPQENVRMLFSDFLVKVQEQDANSGEISAQGPEEVPEELTDGGDVLPADPENGIMNTNLLPGVTKKQRLRGFDGNNFGRIDGKTWNYGSLLYMTVSAGEGKSTPWIRSALPIFGPKENFFMVETNKNSFRGINCRFGMRGVIAAAHYDGQRNFVAMVRGRKRYMLLPPSECSKLELLPRSHPSARHSTVDWSNITEVRQHPSLFEAQATEVVLSMGEVLYIPSYWFHYIISQDASIQCNSRSGDSPEGREHIQACGFYA